MGVHGTAAAAVDGFNFAGTEPSDVRVGYVLALPFRLRLGTWYRQAFALDGQQFDLALLNQLAIPADTTLKDLIQVPHDQLWTRALLVVHEPPVTDEEVLRIRGWDGESSDVPTVLGALAQATEAFNHFLVAYSTVTGEIFGGKPLRLLRFGDFIDLVRWEVVMLCPAGESFPDEDCREILEMRPEREFISSGQINGHLGDLDVDAVREAIGRSIDRQEHYIHEELVFEAKTKMLAGDHAGALLMAVAALEAVHAAFLQQRFHEVVPDDGQLPEDFMRELGMSLCNRFTPHFLMDSSARPDAAVIEQTGHALRIRNEIMHALRNRRGDYRIRTRTPKELGEAYSAVLASYASYVRALGDL